MIQSQVKRTKSIFVDKEIVNKLWDTSLLNQIVFVFPKKIPRAVFLTLTLTLAKTKPDS